MPLKGSWGLWAQEEGWGLRRRAQDGLGRGDTRVLCTQDTEEHRDPPWSLLPMVERSGAGLNPVPGLQAEVAEGGVTGCPDPL